MGEFAQVCAELFLHKKFIATSPILNPTPSLDPGSVRYLEPEVRLVSGSTTLQPQLGSIR